MKFYYVTNIFDLHIFDNETAALLKLWNFIFLSKTPSKNINFKKTHFKVKSRSKAMTVFVFYLWRHLWQTFRTAANFLYNSLLSRNTTFLISGQDFNQSLWKLVQMESTCFKTLKLQNFCKMLVERRETGTS